MGGDSNGHVGSDMGDFGDVHEDYGIGQIKGLGDQIVGLAVGKGLHLINTCFQKRKNLAYNI